MPWFNYPREIKPKTVEDSDQISLQIRQEGIDCTSCVGCSTYVNHDTSNNLTGVSQATLDHGNDGISDNKTTIFHVKPASMLKPETFSSTE